MDGTLLSSALGYAAMGWFVIPLHSPTPSGCSCCKAGCESVGKHPRTMHGLKDATTDPAIIKNWWSMWPEANIGIVTGELSGIVVIDIDDHSEADPVIRAHGGPWATISQRTGSGGQHLVFKHPGGKVKTGTRIFPGMDSRADGGYIVAPPSIHGSGNRYTWELSPDEIDPPLPPSFWLDALRIAPTHVITGEPFKIAQGGRNAALTSFAGTLRKIGAGFDTIMPALAARNKEACDPPLPDHEVETIARSVSGYPSQAESDHELAALGDEIWKGMREYSEALKKISAFPLAPYGEMSLDPPKWLIKGILEDDSLASVFGSSGAGKSYFVMDMACSIASGTDFHGHQTKTRGCVVYIAGEGFSGLAKRIRAWEISRKVSMSDAPLLVSRKSAALCDPVFMVNVHTAVKEAGEKYGRIALIVVDTWARNMAGNENDTQDTSNAIRAVDDLRKLYDCSAIIVHHSGQAEAERARGSSALRAALDVEYKVQNAKDIMIVTNTKMKDGIAPEPMTFGFKTVELGMVDDDGEPVCSSVLEEIDISGITGVAKGPKGKNQRAIIEAIKEAGGSIEISVLRFNLSTKIDYNGWRSAFPALLKSGTILEQDNIVKLI